MYYSQERHSALLKVVQAQTDEQRQAAHAQVSAALTDKNIWVVITPGRTFLSREWPEPPGTAIVSFPDQPTAIRVCEEIGLGLTAGESSVGVISYLQAIEAADKNAALLVMVTYDGDTPHYVSVSHL